MTDSVPAGFLEQGVTTFTYSGRVRKDGRCPPGAAVLLKDENQGVRSSLSLKKGLGALPLEIHRTSIDVLWCSFMIEPGRDGSGKDTN